MSRDVPDVVVFALVVVVAVSAVALPASALGGATATTTTVDGGVAPQTTNGSANESETLAPGQRLAGVVGVQGAEIDGELEERTLATRIDRAESNTSKAAVVATELNTARERLRTLRETQTALREARRSGDISTGEYRARMAITAAQIRAVRTQLDSSEAVTRDLPDAALEARGVNREEIDRLRADADELSGPEVAEIARQIAGDGDDDDENGRENAERTGPPEDAGNGDGDAERTGSPEVAGNGDGDAGAGNRSETAGPPGETGNGEEDDGSEGGPGNSDDAGSGDGSEDDRGNSDDAGNGDGSDGAGSGDGSEDDRGNSGDAGNGDGSDGAGNGDGSDGGGGGDGPGNSGGRDGGNR